VIFQENVSFDHYFGTYPMAANLSGEPLFKADPKTPTINNLLSSIVGEAIHKPDLISERFFVSLTREADTGGLTLETVPVGPLPIRLEKIWAEFDFPGVKFHASEAA
jgi:hypothetical protein